MTIDVDAGLMAAIDSGIADAAPAPVPTGGSDESSSDEISAIADSADSAEGAESGSEGGDDSAPAAADTGGSEGAAEDPEADGKEADPAGDAAKAADAEGKDSEKPEKPADEVKKPDPLNDPLPNALKRETKERINTLVGMVKDFSSKFEAAEKDRTELLGMIEETQATPQQYGQALEYLKLVNSPSREDRERALNFMQQEVAALSRMLGVAVPGVNLLEGHQDLIEEVGTGRLSPERASEIAAAREARNYQATQGQHRQQQAQAQAQAAQVAQQARTALTAVGQRLKATDPSYSAKMQILAPTLKPIFARIPPNQWVEAFNQAYSALPHTVAPARPATVATPAAKPAGGVGNTPLRAGNPAGGQAAAPKSLEEAIERGIADAR